jgi:putative ABC transport system permease protein
VALERIYPDNVVFFAILPYSIGEAMKNDIPEVEDMTRFFGIGQSVVFQYEDQTYEEDKLLFVEPNFFDMFSVPFIQGDPKTVLSTQNSILMVRDAALKYFGDEDPIGKTLITPQGEFLVSGVVENVPKNSHIEFDFLVPLSVTGIQNQPNYISFSVYTYVKLNKSASPDDIETKMPPLGRSRLRQVSLSKTIRLREMDTTTSCSPSRISTSTPISLTKSNPTGTSPMSMSRSESLFF